MSGGGGENQSLNKNKFTKRQCKSEVLLVSCPEKCSCS